MARSLALIAAGAALALPASAAAQPGPVLHPGTPGVTEAATFPAASIARLAQLPSVSSISPKRVTIGHVLTIHGKNFVPGVRRNTIVFARSGGRYVFVKAGRSSTRMMKVMIPKSLVTALNLDKKGAARATRFKIRVLARRFGATFTSAARSPIVAPSGPASVTTPSCNLKSADSDGDGLSNVLEKKIGTDPCNADTDGDGMSDFWEYHSALDYNSGASWRDSLPYPGKRPYPNPLDPSDKGIDFDGDGLTNWDEYRIWAKCGNKTSPNLFMSDGTQTSHPLGEKASPSNPNGQPVSFAYIPSQYRGLDLNQNGQLTDDEKDSDLCDPKGYKGDGLGNWVEAHGPMQPDWWTAIVTKEKAYGLSRYAGTDFLDPDTDGDGILDGADDTDHDGYSNADEINRYVLNPGEQAKYNLPTADPLWVQPFNPCLPDPGPTYRNPLPPSGYDDQPDNGAPPWSGSCSIHHPPADKSWPPFDRTFWNPLASLGGPNLSNTPLRMTDATINAAPDGN